MFGDHKGVGEKTCWDHINLLGENGLYVGQNEGGRPFFSSGNSSHNF